MPEPAIVFPNRLYLEEWRVEWIDDDGGIEVAIFADPKARERALRCADPMPTWRTARISLGERPRGTLPCRHTLRSALALPAP
jgi:hypothetical protein